MCSIKAEISLVCCYVDVDQTIEPRRFLANQVDSVQSYDANKHIGLVPLID